VQTFQELSSGTTAIVVGVQLPEDNPSIVADDLSELVALLSTLGIPVTGRIVQRRAKLSPSCMLGTGKVEELRDLAKSCGARLVVVDRPLSPPQIRNLEEITGCQVTDRSGVILEIFARHARTSEAKTQVEIARLEYLLPRLSGAWTHLHRQRGGGVASRGMGEKQIEVDRRRARERIARLKAQLKNIAREKATQRKSRRNELKVALVGYTNSGKTTVMNALTHARFQAKNALFVTLDANVRVLDPATRPKILLSDTVGFIRNLPHSLIESFKSTLEEVIDADLLLHVVDLSHPNYQAQMDATRKVLREIGADEVPVITVFNKIDSVEDKFLPRIMRGAHPRSIAISALNDEDIVRLRDHVYAVFADGFICADIEMPSDQVDMIRIMFNSCMVLSSDYCTEGVARFLIQGPEAAVARLKPYVVKTWHPEPRGRKPNAKIGSF
jgi:GTP-binding protein HflX